MAFLVLHDLWSVWAENKDRDTIFTRPRVIRFNCMVHSMISS